MCQGSASRAWRRMRRSRFCGISKSVCQGSASRAWRRAVRSHALPGLTQPWHKRGTPWASARSVPKPGGSLTQPWHRRGTPSSSCGLVAARFIAGARATWHRRVRAGPQTAPADRGGGPGAAARITHRTAVRSGRPRPPATARRGQRRHTGSSGSAQSAGSPERAGTEAEHTAGTGLLHRPLSRASRPTSPKDESFGACPGVPLRGIQDCVSRLSAITHRSGSAVVAGARL